jgi:hypothetical protein
MSRFVPNANAYEPKLSNGRMYAAKPNSPKAKRAAGSRFMGNSGHRTTNVASSIHGHHGVTTRERKKVVQRDF